MSIEAPEEVEVHFSREDIEAARTLMEESEILKNDTLSQYVIEHGGMTADKRSVRDLGDFLHARQAVIQAKMAEVQIDSLKERNPEDVMIAHSLLPEFEEK